MFEKKENASFPENKRNEKKEKRESGGCLALDLALAPAPPAPAPALATSAPRRKARLQLTPAKKHLCTRRDVNQLVTCVVTCAVTCYSHMVLSRAVVTCPILPLPLSPLPPSVELTPQRNCWAALLAQSTRGLGPPQRPNSQLPTPNSQPPPTHPRSMEAVSAQKRATSFHATGNVSVYSGNGNVFFPSFPTPVVPIADV